MTNNEEVEAHRADPARLIISLLDVWRDQLALCDALENLADGLPSRADRDGCLRIARAIPSLLAKSHRLEETALFPLLEDRWEALPGLPQTIDTLRFEHLEDEAYAEELHDALLAHGRGLDRPSAETLGYMLRSFFENARRHIRFDTEVLIPLLISASPDADISLSRNAPSGGRYRER